jgi:hypothetical protein
VDVENYDDKMTPYFLAVLKGQIPLAEKLQAYGFANKDYLNIDGDSIQMLAQKLCSRRACRYLGLPEPTRLQKTELKQKIKF